MGYMRTLRRLRAFYIKFGHPFFHHTTLCSTKHIVSNPQTGLRCNYWNYGQFLIGSSDLLIDSSDLLIDSSDLLIDSSDLLIDSSDLCPVI